MSNSTPPENAAQKNAQKYFTKREQGDTPVKQELRKERLAAEVKTAKLRELRLAKEAADRELANRPAGETIPVKAKPGP